MSIVIGDCVSLAIEDIDLGEGNPDTKSVDDSSSEGKAGRILLLGRPDGGSAIPHRQDESYGPHQGHMHSLLPEERISSKLVRRCVRTSTKNKTAGHLRPAVPFHAV